MLAEINQSSARAVRASEDVDLAVAEGLAYLVEVISGDGSGVLTQVGLLFQLPATGAHLFHGDVFADDRLRIIRIAQLARQRIGSARASLVHQHYIALLPHFGDVPDERESLNRALSGTTGQSEECIGKRFFCECGQ